MNETSTTKSEPFANRSARESRRAEIAGVSVRFEDANGEAVRADALNISVEGIFVVVAKPFAIGKRLAFEVHIAGEKKLFSAVGRVEWRREIAEGDARPAGMGIRFIDMEEESTALIRRLLAARESSVRASGTGESAATSAEAFPPPARAHLPTLAGVAPAPPMSMPSRPSMKDPSVADAPPSRALPTPPPQTRPPPPAAPPAVDAAPPPPPAAPPPR